MQEIRIIDPIKDKRWDNFVEHHSFGWICHLSGWKKVLEKSFKHMKGYHLVLLNNDTIQAALPLFEVKSWLTGRRLVSIPFATLSDPLISSSDDMDKLVDSALSLSKATGASYLEIRTLASSSLIQNTALGVTSFFKHHYLPLEDTPEKLMKKFHRTCVRQRITRATNSNIDLRTGETESDVKEFYQLYLLTRKRLGLPPQPYIFFRSLWEIFYPEKRITILLARKNGGSIAGLIIFKFRDRVSVDFSVYDEKFLTISPTHYLFWEAVKSAYSEGYRIFDFGRTSPYNDTLMDFKRRWGTEIADLPYLYYPKEMSRKIGTREKSMSYRLIKKLCSITPQPVFQNLGTFLYNHMS